MLTRGARPACALGSGTSVESQVTVTKPTGERVHAGTMAKKGEGMMAKWQQRWFVLFASGQLQYFSSESEDEASLKCETRRARRARRARRPRRARDNVLP